MGHLGTLGHLSRLVKRGAEVWRLEEFLVPQLQVEVCSDRTGPLGAKSGYMLKVQGQMAI